MSEFSNYNKEGTDLRRAQLVMLDILDHVVKILDKHNIKYWLEGGTLLGAVRHGGFIPWDDDLDIDIYKSDLKKTIKVLETELPDYLYTQTKIVKHIKVRDKNSIYFEAETEHLECNQRGIFIDIFPINKTNMFFQTLINKLYKKTNLIKQINTKNKTKILFIKMYIYVLKAIKLFSKNNAFVAPGFEQYCYPLHLLKPLNSVIFEGKEYSCVNNPELYLTIHYGDYKVIPPIEKRIVHAREIKFL